MDHSEFVAEGTLDVGPSAQYFVFRDGEYLGQQVVEHFKWNTSSGTLQVEQFELPEERGYTRLARVRVTIERLENVRAAKFIPHTNAYPVHGAARRDEQRNGNGTLRATSTRTNGRR